MRNIKIILQKPTNFQTTWVLICVWNQLLIYFGSQKWTQNFGRFPNRIRSDLGSVFGRFLLTKNKIYKTEIELSFTMAHFWRASRLPLNGAQQPKWVRKSCVFEENNMHFVQFNPGQGSKMFKRWHDWKDSIRKSSGWRKRRSCSQRRKIGDFSYFCTKTTFFDFVPDILIFKSYIFRHRVSRRDTRYRKM